MKLPDLCVAFVQQRHQAATAAVGFVSGAASWFIAHASEVASVAGAIGAVATALIALASLVRLIFLPVLCYRRNCRQRKRWEKDPFDEPDDLDLRP